jgi:hypothetical protein
MPAMEERKRKARKKYRDSPEGVEQHRDEEEERRARRRLERVGDRRLETGRAQLQMQPTTAQYARAAQENGDGPDKDQGKQVEWLLVAWPALLAEAELLLGTQAACPCCGRQGLVVRVVSLDEWRDEEAEP